MRLRSILRRADLALALLGLGLLGTAAVSFGRYHVFQASASLARPEPAIRSAVLSGAEQHRVRVAGRLDIPRLRMSVAVVDGNEDEGLAVGAVHLAGSTPLGGAGNAVIAGHRDTAFWPLRNVRLGDLITVRLTRAHVYVVRSIQIVDPDDTSALVDVGREEVTLVTCYPFRYVGSAPQRLVVRTRLIS